MTAIVDALTGQIFHRAVQIMVDILYGLLIAPPLTALCSCPIGVPPFIGFLSYAPYTFHSQAQHLYSLIFTWFITPISTHSLLF